MPRLRLDEKFYSHREVTGFVKNCVIACQRAGPDKYGGLLVREDRLGKLKEFTEALLEPFKELLEDGGISEEELRLVLAASLMYFNEFYCDKRK